MKQILIYEKKILIIFLIIKNRCEIQSFVKIIIYALMIDFINFFP